ncbi:MAG: right-handed parallel beta-helix repeat-containing protein, partial [Gemmatimonadota bacterium]|nr:right-handed parallel beta-helix repeat-containing protein [Gemmatimonadota bacterium]
LLTAALVCAPAPAQERDQRQIDRVEAGEITEAHASWWGFDPEDSTQALQAAINSGAETLIVEDMGSPWVVRPIELAGDQEIVFEDGCEVLAKRGEYKARNATLFTANDIENLTIRGYGATWRMWQEDYDDPELYEKAEWRHCLTLRSVRNVNIYGLTLRDSGGDGIYLGRGPGEPNFNVHIRDLVCDNNYRQGISVITAENLLIEDTILRNTSGTAPQAGIDFEPNSADEPLVNCVMRNCLTENNNGCGYVLYLRNLNADSEPVSVRFENCRAIGDHGYAASLTTDGSVDTAVGGTVEFVDCELTGSASPAIGICKPAEQGLVRFERCTVADVAQDSPAVAPIVFRARSGWSDAVGGAQFEDVVVRDPLDRNPMMYLDQAGGLPLRNVTGNIIIEAADGERTQVELTDEVLAGWMPAVTLTDIPRLSLEGMQLAPPVTDQPAVPDEVRWPVLRRAAEYALYALEGDQVSFAAGFFQVGHYEGDEMPVAITSPSGETVAEGLVPFEGHATVSFTAPETGVYRVSADAGRNRHQITDCTNPIAVLCEGGPARFISWSGELTIWVPQDTTHFGVRVSGEGTGEAIPAALVNPAGEVVGRVDNQFQTHQFEVQQQDGSPGAAWTLRLARPSDVTWEDYYVDVRGVPPLLVPKGVAPLVPVE